MVCQAPLSEYDMTTVSPNGLGWWKFKIHFYLIIWNRTIYLGIYMRALATSLSNHSYKFIWISGTELLRCFDHIIIYTNKNIRLLILENWNLFLENTYLMILTSTKKGFFEIRPLMVEVGGGERDSICIQSKLCVVDIWNV